MRTKILALLAAGAAANAALAQDAVLYLHVLHHSDGESQLIDLGTGREDFGGAARFKTLADNLKAEALVFPSGPWANAGLMISSGDNYLAGPEFNASLAKGVPFYDTIAMELVGYDAATLGNHEFDFGPDTLADFVEGFTSGFPFLSANLDFSGEPRLDALYQNGRIAEMTVVDAAGTPVGIIGLTTPNLPFISSPRDVGVDEDIVGVTQAAVDALKANGVEIIILSSHLQGISEELGLIGQVRGLDIVIAGGGDDLLANGDDVLVPGDASEGPYPTVAADPDGRQVPVVATAGNYAYVGRLIVGFDGSGEIVDTVQPESGPVRVAGGGNPDAVPSDPEVQALVVDPVAGYVEDLANNIIGVTEVELDGRRNNVRARETNLADLIADAHLWTAQNLASDFGVDTPRIAFQNGGGIRNDSVIPVGNISELETFNIQPFGNFVSVVEDVPATQLKEILENAVSAIGTGAGTGRFGQVSGLVFEWDVHRTAQVVDNDGNVLTEGERVRNASLSDGTPIVVDGALVTGDSFDIAIADFLARGGDQYPFRGLPFTVVGVTDQQSLRNFIADGLGGVISAADYPVGGEGRITEVCYADFNGDGGSNSQDVLDFLNAWTAKDGRADCNLDGIVDTRDVICFLNSWNAGC
ncbi:MAG: 5'-nucleotidase C-terminal domain-containing protein [Phycisphaerales bacterium]|nr:5'-nucleotidase C-terminal domain-containing protein [Phycisphaerales bacterium]